MRKPLAPRDIADAIWQASAQNAGMVGSDLSVSSAAVACEQAIAQGHPVARA